MSRSVKKKCPNPYTKEDKYARKHTTREVRRKSAAAAKEAVAYIGSDELDNIYFPPFQKTGGWLTW